MLGKLFDWLDHRTGWRACRDAMLLEHIPGGARWRYVWGSCLAFVFFIQVVTGILLMTAYSPGDSTAWGSVYYIQYEMDFGWLIRGLHHFGSQTMVVLLALHMMQVVIAGAHLPPREINWWIGLLLMSIVLGLSLTGYLLPWDQKGFFATQVATNIAGRIPVLGEFVQKILVGGNEYGNATLTRFFALHVGILPAALVILLVVHIAVFRRHGVTAPARAQGEGWFWPDQAFRDLLVCLAIFGIMLGLVIFGGHGNKIENYPPAFDHFEELAKAGRDGLGANLDAPADRLTEGYPARPEWYFLFLFQLLKYFEGPNMLLGTFIIPNAVMAGLFLLPLFGYGGMRKFGHVLGILYVVALLAIVGMLTVLAIADDAPEPWSMLARNQDAGDSAKDLERRKDFNQRLKEAEHEAQRAVQLAADGIPEEGARMLLRRDPKTQGPRLFAVNCAGCHRYSGWDDVELNKMINNSNGVYKAADLGGYASKEWIRGLLNNPSDDRYFGKTNLTGMKTWRAKLEKTRNKKRNKNAAEAEKTIAEEEANFDRIAQWLSDQAFPGKLDQEADEAGKELFLENCGSCHSFGGEKPRQGPDMTGYGSQTWIRLMIACPIHESRYPKTNAMPAFRPGDGPSAEIYKLEFDELQKLRVQIAKADEADEAKEPMKATPVQILSDVDRELIVRWLTRDYRVVFGGATISGSVRKR